MLKLYNNSYHISSESMKSDKSHLEVNLHLYY
jgi:hypothetical protein